MYMRIQLLASILAFTALSTNAGVPPDLFDREPAPVQQNIQPVSVATQTHNNDSHQSTSVAKYITPVVTTTSALIVGYILGKYQGSTNTFPSQQGKR